jgi:type I restriction enzyme S subunit
VKVVALGDLATINPREARLPPEVAVSFVGMAQLDAEAAIARPLATRSFGEVSTGYTVFRDGDLLAAKITPCWENGKVGQAALDNQIGVGSSEFHVVRPTPGADARYLLHFLRQPSVRIAGEARMTGSAGQKRVPAAFLQDLRVPSFDLREQRRIAAILDQADALRAKRRQILAHLDALNQSIFHDMFGDPGEWPDRWTMATIGDAAASVQYGTSAKAGAVGAWPILRMGNITDWGRIDSTDLKYLDLADADISKYTVRRGDLLFNRTNSAEKVGKAAVVRDETPFALAGYLVRVRMRPIADPEFVSAYLGSDHGRAIRRGMAKLAVNQANISASELKKIPIALPPMDLQRRFARLVAKIESERSRIEASLAKDGELFEVLQSRAFSGQL